MQRVERSSASSGHLLGGQECRTLSTAHLAAVSNTGSLVKTIKAALYQALIVCDTFCALQGLSYPVAWSTVGSTNASAVPEVTLWYDTDCTADPPVAGTTAQQQQRPAGQALAVLPYDAVLTFGSSVRQAVVTWRLPTAAEAPALAAAVAAVTNTSAGPRFARFFVRFRDGVTTNYSEPFDVQAPYQYNIGKQEV